LSVDPYWKKHDDAPPLSLVPVAASDAGSRTHMEMVKVAVGKVAMEGAATATRHAPHTSHTTRW
jgi:hypothetical protein